MGVFGWEITGKDQIIESFSSQPWSPYQVIDPRSIPITEDVIMVIFKVIAERAGCDPYQALICSTFAEIDGSWKMVHHQQSKA